MAFALYQALLVVLRRFSPQLVTAWVVPLLVYRLSYQLQMAPESTYLPLLATVALPQVGVVWQDNERTLLQG